MSTTLAATALLMGLAGGVHCAAMCGAACGAISGAGGGSRTRSLLLFQAGRLAGYAAAGAVAAGTVQAFAGLTSQTAALRPAWTLFHLAVLAWGMGLLVLARQPAWVQQAGRGAWSRVRPLAAAPTGSFIAGLLWTFMPCGLLYSALLVASLSGGPLDGALSMALFAAGSALWLLAAPALFLRLRGAGNRLREDWGTRASGLLLALAAGWALWMDLGERIALWCGIGTRS